MIIKKLELSNFQVIKEFNADFEGNVYFITGDNELGKSTLLKAIGALLTGNRDAVLRNGEDKGFAKMVVGDDGEEYDVELRFTKANPRGTLSIKQKTTGMRSDNVSMLQKVSDIRILTPWSFPGGLKPPRVAESKCNTSGHCCRRMCKNVLPRLTPRL